MYREPSDEQLRGRVGWHARWAVVSGSVSIAGGVIGFLLSRDMPWLAFIAVGLASVLWWNPVRRKFDDGPGESSPDDFFPGGKL